MSVNNELIKKFAALKQLRESLQVEYTKRKTIVDQSRNRYNNILKEVQGIGIGSLEELRMKITEMEKSINDEMTALSVKTIELKGKLDAISNEEAGTTVAG